MDKCPAKHCSHLPHAGDCDDRCFPGCPVCKRPKPSPNEFDTPKLRQLQATCEFLRDVADVVGKDTLAATDLLAVVDKLQGDLYSVIAFAEGVLTTTATGERSWGNLPAADWNKSFLLDVTQRYAWPQRSPHLSRFSEYGTQDDGA